VRSDPTLRIVRSEDQRPAGVSPGSDIWFAYYAAAAENVAERLRERRRTNASARTIKWVLALAVVIVVGGAICFALSR
jgi:hypothetical protein